MRPAQTHYTRSGDVHIAYQVVGEGEFDLVFVPGVITNVELAWEEPAWASFLQRLASFSRLILFDRRGVGLSDRVGGAVTLEERMDDTRAVLDAVGSERAALFGSGDAGAMLALFAATYPERVTALALFSTLPRWKRAADYPWGFDDDEARAWVDEPARRFSDPSYVKELVARIAPSIAGDDELLERLARMWRLNGASPGAVSAFRRMNLAIDIRPVLPTIAVPTVVLQRRDDRFVPRELGRYVADRIPGAEYEELPGEDSLAPWWGDAEAVTAALERFLTSVWRERLWEERESERILATVLFTDIVDATAKASDVGDRAWRDLVREHHTLVRRQLARFRGREIDTAGDGFFAAFDGPARAIRCASSIVHAAPTLGLAVRAGLHTGECELIDGKLGGIAVHIGARVASEAAPGEVLVSSTVKDLVAGAGLRFADRGVHELKGVPGGWRLYAREHEVEGRVG